MVDFSELKKLIDTKIKEMKERRKFKRCYQDAHANWHCYWTNLYDQTGAVPVVDAVDLKKKDVRIEWFSPIALYPELKTRMIVYDKNLRHYVRITVYNVLHPEKPQKTADLTPEEIARLNKLQELGQTNVDEKQVRIAIKRPWGVEFWMPELVVEALKKGHIRREDILGVLPANVKVKEHQWEDPATFYKQHKKIAEQVMKDTRDLAMKIVEAKIKGTESSKEVEVKKEQKESIIDKNKEYILIGVILAAVGLIIWRLR